jgi:hypothetical protein
MIRTRPHLGMCLQHPHPPSYGNHHAPDSVCLDTRRGCTALSCAARVLPVSAAPANIRSIQMISCSSSLKSCEKGNVSFHILPGIYTPAGAGHPSPHYLLQDNENRPYLKRQKRKPHLTSVTHHKVVRRRAPLLKHVACMRLLYSDERV